MAWTTADLLTEVRRLAMLPSSSNSATADSDIFAQADRAMQASVVPYVMAAQEEFFVRKLSVTLTAGTAMVPISRRAVGSRVRNVALVRNNSRIQLARLRIEELDRFRIVTTGAPSSFYLDAANMVLLPTPASNDTLEVSIYCRPGVFTASTNHRNLQSITADTDYLGNSAPGRTRLTWSGVLAVSTLGTPIDIISRFPPFEHKALDITYNSAGGSVSSIDVATSDLLATPSILDIVCPSGESSVVQLPVECHPLLYQRTTQFLLEQLGYAQEANTAKDTADRMEAALHAVLMPRTDGNPQRLAGGALDLIQRAGFGVWRW